MPVANVPQQAGLEGVGVGHNPAPLLFPDNVQQQGGDGVRRSPIHVYVPQEHQEQQDHLQIDIEGHVPPVGKDGAVGGVPPAGRVPAPPHAPPAEEAEEEHVPPAEAIAPQEKVAQVARITAALAEELLQKQKETVRNIALALNEIIILSHEFANSSIDLRLSDLKHLNNLFPPAAGDEDNIILKNMWGSGTIGITKYNGKCLLSSYTGRTSATTIGGDLELPNGSIMGGAYNYVLSHFKYKNHTDKVAAHTHVISIYGQTNLSEKLIYSINLKSCKNG